MKIDAWLLDRIFQPFSDWFQRLTGKDNFFLAHAFNLLNIAACLSFDRAERQLWCDWINVLIFFSLATCIQLVAGTVDRGTGTVRAANIQRMFPIAVFIRVTSVFLPLLVVLSSLSHAIYDSRLWLFITVALSFTALLYFMACTPLPPCDSKVREWTRSLAQTMKRALPRLVPSPASS